MRTLALVTAVASCAVAACALAGEHGSGTVKEESRPAAAFHAFEASGAVEVHWHPGPLAITVRADDNLIGRVKTEVAGGTLRIYTEGHNLSFSHRPVIELHSPTLDGLGASGATKVSADGLSTERLSVELSGASQLEAQGRARSLNVQLSGASHVAMQRLACEELAFGASGASNGSASATRSVAAHLSGASHLSVAGHPPSVTQDVSGASSLSLD